MTLFLPPDPPDPPAGCGSEEFYRCLQSFFDVGGGWRIEEISSGMCQIRQTRQEVGLFRKRLRGEWRTDRPNPPTPFPSGEGGDSDVSVRVYGYTVGKVAAEFRAADLVLAYGIICSVVQ